MKNLLSTLVVSLVAISMVACDSKDSKKGSKNTPATTQQETSEPAVEKTAIDMSLEAQKARKEATIKSLNEEIADIETEIESLAKPFADVNQEIRFNLKRVETMVGAPEGAQAEFTKALVDSQTRLSNLKNHNSEMSKAISRREGDIRLAQAELAIIDAKIDINDVKTSSDYKNGHPRLQGIVDRKEKAIIELQNNLDSFSR